MTTAEAARLARARVSDDEIIALARKLISIPSHHEVPGKEKEVADFLARYLPDQGLTCTIQKVDGERGNVIATLPGAGGTIDGRGGSGRGSGGRKLLFNGHLDTVPPYRMTVDPFAGEIKDGKLYGRGTVDMKGPITAMLMAMIGLHRAGVSLAGELVFTGVLGEEGASEGTERLVLDGIKADGAIVGEPSNFEYAMGHRGLEWLEIEVTGKTAHGGIPDKGINAIVKAARLVSLIDQRIPPALKERFHPAMGPSVMNFGKIEGGTQPSTVADRCIIQIDRRYIPGETVQGVIAEYQALIDELSATDPDFKAEIRRMPSNMMEHFDHVPMATPEGADIVKAVQSAIRSVTGAEPAITTRRGWTDAGLLGGVAGIPTVVCGPGDISASHTADEHIPVANLLKGVDLYLMAAIEFCGLASQETTQAAPQGATP
jgi:acetylornithine deacetylase/succinyl-diaminopimelate desuccinylase